LLLRCSVYDQYDNTYAGLLENYIRSNCIESEIDGYDNYLEKALDDTGVTLDLYNNIIKFGRSIAPEMERYHEIKRQQLGFDQLKVADIYLASNGYTPKQVSYEDAVNTGREAIKVLGNDYMEKFDQVVTNSHVDVYPSDTKDNSAFTTAKGLVTFPYVLLNFNGSETYTGTLVHEMGHSCYYQFSSSSQHYFNQNPTLFTHEVAAIVNEFLFYNYMLENAKTKDEKTFWLETLIIDLFNGKIVRQCIYSEFEDWCYKTIESGDYLTADDMKSKFVELFREYYPSLDVPDEYGTDWVRLDHFYYDYYVYQYATSSVYAAAIVDRILTLGQPAIDSYKEFLKAGNSRSIDELLQLAGVDPYDQSTYDFASEQLKRLVDEYEALVRN
ncbi:MAG: hypothetical protein K6G51_00430, partial [Sphaerochaetaceae bacterium]|nr:hypothetical protein [Sphaerochaetaceae bacterium]